VLAELSPERDLTKEGAANARPELPFLLACPHLLLQCSLTSSSASPVTRATAAVPFDVPVCMSPTHNDEPPVGNVGWCCLQVRTAGQETQVTELQGTEKGTI